jgi:ribonucleotide monophosphatase NagD (HAD superfamily)
MVTVTWAAAAVVITTDGVEAADIIMVGDTIATDIRLQAAASLAASLIDEAACGSRHLRRPGR